MRGFKPQAYLKAPNGQSNDEFGRSVAISGDTIEVGGHFEDSTQTTINNGATASSHNSAEGAGAGLPTAIPWSSNPISLAGQRRIEREHMLGPRLGGRSTPYTNSPRCRPQRIGKLASPAINALLERRRARPRPPNPACPERVVIAKKAAWFLQLIPGSTR